MANPRTLLQLRTSVVERGQYESSNDINPVGNPALLNELINVAISEIYDVLVQKWQDLYTVTGTAFTTTAGQDSYLLDTIAPAFYKLRKVEILWSGTAGDPAATWKRLLPHDIDASHHYSQYGLISKGYRYRLQGQNLVLAPPPTVIETLRVFFIPYATRLANDGDTFDGINGYEELVIQTALMHCKRREDLPTDDIEREIAKQVARVRTAADGRDAAEPFYLNPNGPTLDLDDDEGHWW